MYVVEEGVGARNAPQCLKVEQAASADSLSISDRDIDWITLLCDVVGVLELCFCAGANGVGIVVGISDRSRRRRSGRTSYTVELVELALPTLDGISRKHLLAIQHVRMNHICRLRFDDRNSTHCSSCFLVSSRTVSRIIELLYHNATSDSFAKSDIFVAILLIKQSV